MPIRLRPENGCACSTVIFGMGRLVFNQMIHSPPLIRLLNTAWTMILLVHQRIGFRLIRWVTIFYR